MQGNGQDSASATLEKFLGSPVIGGAASTPGPRTRIPEPQEVLAPEIAVQAEALLKDTDLILAEANASFEAQCEKLALAEEHYTQEQLQSILEVNNNLITKLREGLERFIVRIDGYLVKTKLETEDEAHLAKLPVLLEKLNQKTIELTESSDQKKQFAQELMTTIKFKSKFDTFYGDCKAQFEAASKQFKEVVGHSGFEQAEIAYNSYEETINKLNEMLRGIKTQGSAYLTEKMVCQDKLVERLSTILASLDTIQSKLHDSLDRKKRIMKALRAKSIGWYGSYIELRNTLMEKHKCLPEFIEVMQSDNTFLRDPKSYFLMTYKGADESDLTAFRQNLAVLLVEIIGYADDYIRKRQPSFARSLIQLNEISAEKIKWANVLKDFTMTLASSSWHTVQKLWALYHLLHQLETTNQNKRLIDEPGTHFPKMIRQCRGGVDAAKELLPSAIGELDESDQSEFYQVRLYTPAMNEELAHDQKSISSSSSRVLAAVGSFLSLRAGAAAYSPARGGAGGAEANGGAGHEHSTSVFPWGEII